MAEAPDSSAVLGCSIGSVELWSSLRAWVRMKMFPQHQVGNDEG